MGWIGETVDSVKSIKMRQALTMAITLVLEAPSFGATLYGPSFIILILRVELIAVARLHSELEAIPGMIVTSALIMWKALMCFTGSESPVVVVLSESMEPGFQRGDILFLTMSRDPIRAGEIVVFNVDGRPIPIVHRVIKVHEQEATKEVYALTKGDNNFDDDRSLYAPGQLWLQQRHVMGRAVGFLPYVGWVTLIMTELPVLKYALLGALGLLVITSKD